LSEGVGSIGLEHTSVPLMTGTGSSSQYGELNVVVSELNASWSSDFLFFVEHSCSDDGNGIGRSTMITSHF